MECLVSPKVCLHLLLLIAPRPEELTLRFPASQEPLALPSSPPLLKTLLFTLPLRHLPNPIHQATSGLHLSSSLLC